LVTKFLTSVVVVRLGQIEVGTGAVGMIVGDRVGFGVGEEVGKVDGV
jgi:hypothetical protein